MANTNTAPISTETIDYLALLPEDIIQSHILPKLSTIEAARTCILSKRWKSLWTSFPYLDFYQFHFQHIYTFRDFVDKTIKDHARNETNILRFKLYLTRGIRNSDIDNWVRLVMSRNVKEFHLRILAREPYQWPLRNVCMANTITLLELDNCVVKLDSTNNTITLPHLHTLYFDNVWIDQRTIEKFLSGCPSMSDLKVWSCYELKYLVVANLPQLKRVCIGACIWLQNIGILHVPCLQSLSLYLTQSFVTLSSTGFALDSGAYETLKELHLCNYSKQEDEFQDLLSALKNLECLTLESVKQCSQNIRITSKNLKKLVLDHCNFLMVNITTPNLTSFKSENNLIMLYSAGINNVKDYIFSNYCNYLIFPAEKSLTFESVKYFLKTSTNDLWEGTKMIIDLHWCNYTVVLEDSEIIAELPYTTIDRIFPKGIYVSNRSFSEMAEWFLDHNLCFSRKLLIIFSDESKFYKALKEKNQNSYRDSPSFTMNREAFERNTGLSVDSMCNKNRENIHRIAFLNALFEVEFNTKQAIVLETL